jgi:hypothetical protein
MKNNLLLPATLLIALLVFLAWVCLHAGSQGGSSEVVRVYFAGTNSISGDTNAAAIENIFGCSQARALESQTLDKLSHAPGIWFKDKLPAGTNDGSAQLRPLLDDFLKSKWIFEMRQAPGAPEYALAIRLDDSRAQLWMNNLRGLLESWTKINAQNIPGGWELKQGMPGNLFRMVRAGDWVVAGCGQDELPLSEAWSQGEIAQNETNWLSAELDWPRLAHIFPALAKFDFPKTELQVTEADGDLKLAGKFHLSQPLPPLEKWQIPANMMHPPLTSFTAVRGFGSWLKKQPWPRLQAISPTPNQAFIWSTRGAPLQTYMAVQVSNATNALAQLGQNLTANTNWENQLLFPVDINCTADAITWQDVPYLQPEITARTGPTGEYLLADVTPYLPHKKPLPERLLIAANRENLVYYHWEITSERLADLPHITQMALMMTQQKQLERNEAANQWLDYVGPLLGNSVTEVTRTGPSELSFMRTAPAGLTAIELMALASWLEAPNFPGCDLKLPAPTFPEHRHHKKTATSAPRPGR